MIVFDAVTCGNLLMIALFRLTSCASDIPVLLKLMIDVFGKFVRFTELAFKVRIGEA